MKIPRKELDPVWRARPEEFGSFAKVMVEALRKIEDGLS